MPLGEGYTHNDRGMIEYPQDQALRLILFDPESMRHPAKANLHMIMDIVERVSVAGETILDPMSGTGSIMVAAQADRHVVCVEIEDGYHQLQRNSKAKLESIRGEGGRITLIHANCHDVLPLPVDHCIFSPPYANLMNPTTKRAREGGSSGYTITNEYRQSPGNIGRLPRFFYNQEMERVYKGLFQSLRPGGTMTVIIKEFIQGGKRVPLTSDMVRMCVYQGFEVEEWAKRFTLGGFVSQWKSRGMRTVDDEDLVVLRKPTKEGRNAH